MTPLEVLEARLTKDGQSLTLDSDEHVIWQGPCSGTTQYPSPFLKVDGTRYSVRRLAYQSLYGDKDFDPDTFVHTTCGASRCIRHLRRGV